MTITAPATRKVARAEPVGSLLRSPEIAAAMDRLCTERACRPSRSMVLLEDPTVLLAVTEAADRVIPRLVQRQLDAGLDVVTDGEVRRSIFLSSFYDAVEGLAAPGGELSIYDSEGKLVLEGLADPDIATRVRKAYSPLSEEVSFLRGLGDFPFKVTLPAPSYFYMSDFVPLSRDSGYDTRQEFIDDVIEIEQSLIAEAVAAGARWIQLDFPLYPALVDDAYVSKLDSNATADELLERALAADTKVVEHVPPGITLGLHLCRGNVIGGFWSGSLEPVAEQMFNELPQHRFLVEWEDVEREGDYSPLRYVPKDKIIALGLVSTKTSELESDDQVVSRLDEAARYLDFDQLALCSQCGFASLYRDTLVETEDPQWRKLELIGRVADRVWGTA